jgi:hypothetical protein
MTRSEARWARSLSVVALAARDSHVASWCCSVRTWAKTGKGNVLHVESDLCGALDSPGRAEGPCCHRRDLR